MVRALIALACVIALAAAVWAGRLSARPAATTTDVEQLLRSMDERLDHMSQQLNALQKVTAAQQRVLLSQSAPGPEATVARPEALTVASPPPRPDPEQVENHRKAVALLENAIRRARWTDDDRKQMRRLLREVPNEQRAEVLAQLADALNTGRLGTDIVGSFF